MARFFVELPADEYGNTGTKKAVIECVVETMDRGPVQWTEHLRPVAPEHYAQHWGGTPRSGWWRYDMGGEELWAETEGPARMLTLDEWSELVGWQGCEHCGTRVGERDGVLVHYYTGDRACKGRITSPQTFASVAREG